MRKNILIALLASIMSLTYAISAEKSPSSGEIIKKNIESMGGQDRIASMENMKVIFDADSPQLRGEITIWIKDGDSFRMDVNQGAQNPVNSLLINPSFGLGNNATGGVDTIKEPQLANYRQMFSYQTSIFKSPLFGYDPSNTIANFIGMENKEGKKYYVIEIAPKSVPQQKSKVFVDENTYFVNYILSETPNGNVLTELKDYKKTDGISYPSLITSKFNGQIQSKFMVKELNVKPSFSKGLFNSIN